MIFSYVRYPFAVALLAGVLLFSPGTPVGVGHAYAGKCDTLASEFKRRGKPSFLRVVNKNRSLANYFNSTLKRLRAGSTPTTAEIRKAYNRTQKSCSTGKCRSDAKAIYNASLKLHAYNRRWARSGCSGTLGT